MSTLSQGWRRDSLPIAAAGINRAIFQAAVSVGAAGIFVKVLATFKEVAVASVYGRSDAMDAFLAAALIPSLLVNLISESMNQALVPTLVRVREQEGRERAQRLLSSSMLWMCVLLAAASAVMALLARSFFPLIASHFAPAKLALPCTSSVRCCRLFSSPESPPIALRSQHG